MSKISYDRASLVKAISFVDGAISNTSLDESERHIVFLKNGTVAAASATMSASTRAAIESDEDFLPFSLPGDRIGSILRLLETPNVSFNVGPDSTTISAGRSRYRFSSSEHSEKVLKRLETLANDKVISEVKLADGINAFTFSSRFAAQKDSVGAYILTAIKTDISDGCLRTSATNGAVAASSAIEAPPTDEKASYVVPSHCVNLIKRLDGDKIKFSVGDTFVAFTSTGAEEKRIAVRLLGGSMPDIHSLLTRLNDNQTMAFKLSNTNGLISALKRLEAAFPSSSLKKATFNFSAGDIRVEAKNSDGSFEEVVEQCYSGEGQTTVDLSVAYFLEILSAIDDEELTISFGEPGSPVRVSSVYKDVCLMPMA